MAVSFSVPKSPAKSVLTIDTFLGADFTNSPGSCENTKSPNTVNMIRDVPGKIRKCMGYETIATYLDSNDKPLEINGYHLLRSDEHGFIHAGENIYWGDILLYTSANNARSKAWQFEKDLYMLDGKKLLVLSSTETSPTTSTGKHTKEVDDSTYTETLTLKSNDVVNFYMPFECKQLNVTYNGITATITLADVDTYSFTNTYGNYECEFEFTASDIVLTYEGTHTSVINATISNGYVDGTSGTYVDENGYIHKVGKAEDNAYIPTVTISKDPEGGGTPYEDINLLSVAFTETFLGKAGIYDYNLSFQNLADTPPKVWLLNGSGEWIEKTYSTDYSYNKATGVVHFTSPPGVSPVSGQDNVKITAYRTGIDTETGEVYADRINKCTFGTLFGVNGALDRLFVSGNPDYINYDWYSDQYDPTYFTDTSYSMLGSSASAIMGYSVISNYLAAHKDYMEKDQNIILREGDLVDNEPSFRIINTLQGAGAVGKYTFAYLSTEPLFLTKSGIYAVTAQDITGEKYAQNRSYFLDGKLLDEKNLEDAFGFVYKDMYWLCLNGVAYILDGLQPVHTDKSKPYSTRQYVGFYRTNLPARVMWEHDERLFFGTADGRVCRFYDDKYALASYNDDGEPIEAIWETPDIDGKLFYKNKTLRYIALRLDAAIATSVNIWVMNRGLWQFIKKDEASGRYLTFSRLVFSKFSFSSDKTQHTIPTKVRVKKVDKFRLRITNDALDEPFGVFNIAFEYVENGNYKG